MYTYVNKAIELLENRDLFDSFEDSTITTALNTFKTWNLNTKATNKNAALPILSFARIIDVEPGLINQEIIYLNLILAKKTVYP